MQSVLTDRLDSSNDVIEDMKRFAILTICDYMYRGIWIRSKFNPYPKQLKVF